MQADKLMGETNRAVMAKKYGLNDGTRTFVEVNTLLEPANNSSAV